MHNTKTSRLQGGFLAIIVAEFFLYPRFSIYGAYVRPVDLLILCVFVIILFQYFLHRNDLIDPSGLLERNGIITPLFILLISTIISAIFANYLNLAIKDTIQLVELAIIVYITNIISHYNESRARIILTILVMSLFEAILGAFQFITNTGNIYLQPSIVRASGTLGNELAGYLLVGVVAGLAFLVGKCLYDRIPLWLPILATSLVTAVLILTQVRGAWITLFFILAGCLLFYHVYWKRLLAVGLVTMVFLMIFLMGRALLLSESRPGEGIGDEFTKALEKRGATTINSRFLLWQTAVKMWRNNPLLGVGPGNYGQVLTKYSLTDMDLRIMIERFHLSPEIDAHSGFFTQLAEGGALGLASQLFLLLSSIGIAWRSYRFRHTKGYIEVWEVASFLIVIVSLPAYFYSVLPGTKLYWIILGMLATTTREMTFKSHNKEGRLKGGILKG